MLLTLCFAITSCESSREKQIVGKWQYASWKMAGETIDLNNLGNPVVDFQEGGIFIVKAGFQENTEKWRLDKDTLFFEQKDGNTQKHLLNIVGNDTLKLTGASGDWPTELLLVRIKE